MRKRCIGKCAGSLAAQDYPNFEVIVLNDHSTDDTEKILLSLGFDPAKPAATALLSGEPLPQELECGKNWRPSPPALRSTRRAIIFTSRTPTHGMRRRCVASIIATHAQKSRTDLLSPWQTRHAMSTWSEKLIIPLLYFLSVGLFPFAFLAETPARPSRKRRQKLPVRAPAGTLGFTPMASRCFSKNPPTKESAVTQPCAPTWSRMWRWGEAVAERISEGMRLENCRLGARSSDAGCIPVVP